MQLVQTLEEPVSGYFNNGPKRVFNWKIDGKPNSEDRIKVGSWGANYWFYAAVGKTELQTLGNARRHLTAAAKRAGQKCEFEYATDEWED